MKPVASRNTIHWRSSHSREMKKNVAMNEMTRINRNCSKDIPWEEVADHLSYHIKRLQYSGYLVDLRQQIVNDTLKYIDRPQRRSHRNATTPTNDPQQWYMNDGQFESVMFIEATPGSELTNRIKTAVVRSGLRIKCVEKAGTTVKDILQKSNPFGVNHCSRPNCNVCERGYSIDCRTRGCVYEYACEECGRKYCGQTGRTMYERNNEHIAAWIEGDYECPLQRHSNVYHSGDKFNVDLQIVAKCYRKQSKRMITEAVRIGEIPDGIQGFKMYHWYFTKLQETNKIK